MARAVGMSVVQNVNGAQINGSTRIVIEQPAGTADQPAPPRPAHERLMRSWAAIPPSSAAHWLAIIGLVAVAAVVYLFHLRSFQVGIFADDAVYIVLARALADGEGYVLASFPGNPPELRYPPGYPLLLTPIALFFHDSLDMYRVPSLLLGLGSIPLWFIFFRRRTTLAISLLVTLAAALNPLIVRDATVAMAESAFQFFLAALLIAVDAGTSQNADRPRRRVLAAVAIAGCCIALFFIRSAGIAFVPGVLLYLLWRREGRLALAVAILFAGPFLGWGIRNANEGHPAFVSAGYEGIVSTSLASQAQVQGAANGVPTAGLAERVVTNAWTYLVLRIPEALELSAGAPKAVELHLFTARSSGLVDASRIPWLPGLAGLAVTLIVASGYLRRARLSLSVAELSILFYGAVLILYPWAWLRFLAPILPLVYFWLAEGVVLCLGAIRTTTIQQRRFHGATVILLALVALNMIRDVQAYESPPSEWLNDISIGSTWLASNAPEDSVVMAQAPLQEHLYSETETIRYPDVSGLSPEHLLTQLETSGADFVLVKPRFWAEDLDPQAKAVKTVLEEHPQRFRLVYEHADENVRVYELIGIK
jgi:4-amino-4-deoxy-L-arabinose transferase-like glycosyltransferase